MSSRKYRFVGPGVFLSEVDNSQILKTPNPIGPVVIGRTERGPAMKPITVSSFSEFIEVFGNPIPGGKGGDIWRDGNYTAPTYAAYAAQAWLKNNSPCTVVRLLGAEHTDATTLGAAGWQTTALSPTTASATNGGAYGLFVGNYNSSSADQGTMALAAVFYVNEGSIRLSGSSPDGTAIDGAAAVVRSVGANFEFKAIIENKSGVGVLTSSFNLDKNSAVYIRNVFNTNPTLVNSDITQQGTGDFGDSGVQETNNLKTYWLGESYDKFVLSTFTGSTSAGGQIAVLLPLQSTAMNGADYRMGLSAAKSGWIFAQDLSTTTGSYSPSAMTKLFRFATHENGEWDQKNLKISISNVRTSNDPDDPYGSFSVEIRKVRDSDNAPIFVERFSSVNLNPSSDNYIAKKIGDMRQVWDDTERRYIEFGNYKNQSKFVRVEMNPDVDAGSTDARLVPFGFYGVPRFTTVSYTSGSFSGLTPVRGLGSVPVHGQRVGSAAIDSGISAFSCSFAFPKLSYRADTTEGTPTNYKVGYWGITTTQTTTSLKFENSYVDMVRAKPADVNSYDADTDVATSVSVMFSLDDVAWVSGSTLQAEWAEGNRAAGTSITAGRYYDATGAGQLLVPPSYEHVLDAGFNKFTLPLFGGFDGLDITEKEPFRNSQWDSSTPTEQTDYAFNSIKRAIDCIADAEVVDGNLACVPGCTQDGLTSYLLTVCESRGDMLAIIDLEGGFRPSTENALGDSSTENRGDVDTTVSDLKTRGLNTSYGCSYYPWVQIRDSINGAMLWVPPSVIMLGTMASSENSSELWFAPAGFTRGGLSEGSAGVPVISVREKLTSAKRDKLYEAGINPIATFPNQGIVVFGQKTLQMTPSALDRINVRRLMIYLKKEISRMAATTLFDPNVQVTWNRFLAKADPFLASVKSRLGISEYKLILDETTTTPDLVDRNIVYAKVLIKPVKAIEYFVLDFAIAPQGASFED